MVEGSSGEGRSLLRDTYFLEILCGIFFALWISANIFRGNFFLHEFYGYINLLSWPILFLYLIARAIYHEKQPSYLNNLCAMVGSLIVAVILFTVINAMTTPPADNGNVRLSVKTENIPDESGNTLVLKSTEPKDSPQWATVKEFIINHSMIDKENSDLKMGTVEYAVKLHNEAELAGMNAGIVKIDYGNIVDNRKVPGIVKTQYINIYWTYMNKDQVLVYVDCTSKGYGVPHIVNMPGDQRYGLISIEDFDTNGYSYFDRIQNNQNNYTMYLGAISDLQRDERTLANYSLQYPPEKRGTSVQGYMDFINNSIRLSREKIEMHTTHPEWYTTELYDTVYNGTHLYVIDCKTYF